MSMFSRDSKIMLSVGIVTLKHFTRTHQMIRYAIDIGTGKIHIGPSAFCIHDDIKEKACMPSEIRGYARVMGDGTFEHRLSYIRPANNDRSTSISIEDHYDHPVIQNMEARGFKRSTEWFF